MALFGLLLATAYVPGLMYSGTAGRWAVVMVGAPALLLFDQRALAFPPWIRWLGLALLLYIIASMSYTVSPWDTLGALFHWTALSVLFVWASRQTSLERFWFWFGVGVCVSLPFAFAQYLGYHPVDDISRLGFLSPPGLFLTPNVLAECAAVAFIAAFYLEQPLLCIPLGAILLLAGRNEAWLMLSTAIFVGLWISVPRRRLALIFVALGLAGNVGWLLYTIGVPTRLLTSNAVRLSIWVDTVEHFSWLGSGLGVYESQFPQYPFAHNEALQLIYEIGPAAALVAVVVGYAVFAPVKCERVVFTALGASAMVWAPLQNPVTAALAVLCAGFLVGVRARANRAQSALRPNDIRRAAYARHLAPRAFRPADGGDGVVPI